MFLVNIISWERTILWPPPEMVLVRFALKGSEIIWSVHIWAQTMLRTLKRTNCENTLKYFLIFHKCEYSTCFSLLMVLSSSSELHSSSSECISSNSCTSSNTFLKRNQKASQILKSMWVELRRCHIPKTLNFSYSRHNSCNTEAEVSIVMSQNL